MTRRFISVKATLPSRRRSGFQFGKEAVVLDVEEIGEDVIGYLRQDPILVIKEITQEQVDALSQKLGEIDASQTQIIPISAQLLQASASSLIRYRARLIQDADDGWRDIGPNRADIINWMSNDLAEVQESISDNHWRPISRVGLGQMLHEMADDLRAFRKNEADSDQQIASAKDEKAAPTAKPSKAKGGDGAKV